MDYSLHGIIWLGSSGFRIFLLNRSIAVRGSFLTVLSRKADHLHFLKNYKRLRLTLHSKTTTYRHFATIMCASSTLYLVFTGGIQKGICVGSTVYIGLSSQRTRVRFYVVQCKSKKCNLKKKTANRDLKNQLDTLINTNN